VASSLKRKNASRARGRGASSSVSSVPSTSKEMFTLPCPR
jgi:hypothetical protein